MGQLVDRITVVAEGKGPAGALARARSLSSRYGLRPDRMDRALAQFADLLRPIDGKATLPITAVSLARHGSMVAKYADQGIEFAAHGLLHIDHSQLSLDDQLAHFQRIRRVFDEAGLGVTGFRAPYLRSNSATLRALQECGFSYDSSQALVWDVVDEPENEALGRVLRFYRAQKVEQHPSLPRMVEGLVRIPYCLPDDEALVERMRLAEGRAMAGIWRDMLHRAHRLDELFTLGLHPERIAECYAALRATLEEAQSFSPGIWIARLDEIADWWRVREATRIEVTSLADQGFQVCVSAHDGVTVQLRGAEVMAPTATWTDGYQRVLADHFVVHSTHRPLIGASPGTSPDLVRFLQEQGFFIEMSGHRDDFAYYVDQASFSADQGHNLLGMIDSARSPLLRLGRWPYGHRGALAITGDIDALTLWDYALRLLGR